MKGKLSIYRAVGGLYLILFTQMLDTSIAVLSLLVISIDLHLDVYRAAGIMTFYGVGIVIAFPMGAFLTKHFSEGLLFIIGSLVFIVTSLGCGLANDANTFLLFRFIQGLGAGFSVVVCQTLMIQVLGDDKRPLALSLTMSAVTLAPVFGPFFGSLITEYLSWRWLFLSNIPLTAIGVFVVISFLDFKVKREEAFKWGYFTSLLLFALFVSTVQFIFDFGETFGWYSAVEIKLALFVAIAAAVVFYFCNRDENRRIFNFSQLKEPNYGLTTLILTFGNGIIVSSLVILPIWLQIDYGLSIIQAGLIVSVASALAAFISPLIGKYFPEKHYIPLSIFSISTTALSFFLMAKFSNDVSQEYIIVARVVAGLGIATFSAPLLAISFKKLAVENITQANSLSLTLRLYSANLFITISLYVWSQKQFYLYEEVLLRADRSFLVSDVSDKLQAAFSFILKNNRVEAMNQMMLVYCFAFLLAIGPLLYLFYSSKKQAPKESSSKALASS